MLHLFFLKQKNAILLERPECKSDLAFAFSVAELFKMQ